MKRWIALLRGVNVGGKNIVKMAELRAALTASGAASVSTYIQSGNIVLDLDCTERAAAAELVSTTIATHFDVSPAVLVLTPGEIAAAIDANPFAAHDSEPKMIHLFFTSAAVVESEVVELRTLAAHDEEIIAGDHVVYLYTPNGMARSKLGARVDRVISSPVTARNLRSATAIRDLATK